MKLSSVKRIPHEEVIVYFMEAIESGGFLPGETLPSIKEIADKLGYTEAEVAHAIKVLKAENILLDKTDGSLMLAKSDKDLIVEFVRSRILHIQPEDIISLLEIREGLETRSFVLATERATEQDLKSVEAALQALEARVKLQKTAAKEDLRFHLELVKASHNSMMTDLVEIIFERFFETLHDTRTSIRKLDNVDHFIDVHREIYNALVARDAELGVILMKKHIEQTIALYKNLS
ncbi:FadR/GntR family transcriptional regulator [Wohlfahrtiimonas larvae]|uniref:FadR/GntR family transcriptional regulator n=1 Tax=Wohlfahrtiimonas larvae TaxID=1157986 RepID=A0ABP9MMZ5_9GAMM|nr:FCD domain-containing protein [Wohlfahrtiimonas larvae]